MKVWYVSESLPKPVKILEGFDGVVDEGYICFRGPRDLVKILYVLYRVPDYGFLFFRAPPDALKI